MTEQQTISWIYMSIGMVSSQGSTDANLEAISEIADMINHAVPNSEELQYSIQWLIEKGLIIDNNNRYSLSNIGSAEFKKAMKLSGRFAKWNYLEKVVKNYSL